MPPSGSAPGLAPDTARQRRVVRPVRRVADGAASLPNTRPVMGYRVDMLVVAICSARAIACAARLTGTLRLDRRARHRTVGAEHATISRLRPQAGSAAGAFVIESAGVRRHGLGFGYAAVRTSNDRLEDHAFRRRPRCLWWW